MLKPFSVVSPMIPMSLLLCLAQPIHTYAQQPAGTASLSGTVNRADTGEPMAGVTVTLSFIPPPTPPRLAAGTPAVNVFMDGFSAGVFAPSITSSAPANAPTMGTAPPASSIPPVITDGSGTFTFSNLTAGTYRLIAASNGFVTQEYGRVSSVSLNNTGPINLTAGQKLAGLLFKLTPTGNVSGRVLDVRGQPVAGIPVNLYRRQYGSVTGDYSATSVAAVRTNDRGEYRIFWIAPGRYYLVAGGTATGARGQQGVLNDVSETFGYSFYPPASNIDAATAIDVRPGADLRGHDFRVEQQSLYRITGKVVDSRTGQPPAGGSLSVTGRSPIGNRSSGGRVQYDSATGQFQVIDVPPGLYSLTANVTSNAADRAMTSASTVRVTNADVRDVTVTIVQGRTMSGKVRAEGALPAGVRFSVRLVPSSNSPTPLTANAQVNPDGTFTFDATAFRYGASEYRLALNGQVPAGWYLKEATLNGADILNDFATLPADGTLDVLLSSEGGQVSGSLRNERAQAVSRIYAVLVPEGATPKLDLIQQAMSDPTGRFNFPNVPPGNYKVFSWEDVEAGSWFDVDWLKQWDAKGVSVSVPANARPTVELKTIPSGGWQ